MAQLKNLLVNGPSKFLGPVLTNLTDNKVVITEAGGKLATRDLLNNTAVGPSGWAGSAANNTQVLTHNTLAYWNGAYSGTSSNLEYFKGGKIEKVGHNHDTTYAKLRTWNDMIHSDNEVTWVPGGYNNYVWLNYRSADGLTNTSTVTGYKFGNAKGTMAGVTVEAEKFKGAFEGNASTATTLQTSRTIFGKSFNGSANVEGHGMFYGTYTSTAANRYSNGGVEVREQGLVGNSQSDIGYAPTIGFHWGGRVAASLLFHNDGKFYFKKQNGVDRATVDADLSGNAASSSTFAVTDGVQSGMNYLVYTTGASGNQTPRVEASLYHYDTGSAGYLNVGSASRLGALTLHQTNGGYVNIVPGTLTANTTRTVTLLDKTGNMVLADAVNKGSAYVPTYLSAGMVTACSNPSMLTNLGSTSAASVFAASPRPGVTGTLPVGNGGTGQTTGRNAMNYFINELATGDSTPTDGDYYISQYVGGNGTTPNTNYYRRPMSKLYDYIKGKTDTVYLAKTARGGATTPIYINSSGNSVACTMSASGNRYGCLPFIAADGVMEVGRYIDFHISDTETADYKARITCNSGSIVFSFG